MSKSLYMLSGIPRSGSQVLASMLNQHPDIYASTTSPLADLLVIVYDKWVELSAGQLTKVPQQLPSIVSGIINGTYAHINKPFIIDKNRIWPRYAEQVYNTFEVKPGIIATVRPIPEILSSFILLIEKNSDKVTYIDQDLINLNLPINTFNRCKILWEKYIIHPYLSLKIGCESNCANFLFLDYNSIVNDSQSTVNRVTDFIGASRFTIDLDNLQPMDENDDFHGGLSGLHTVRKQMKRISPRPEEVIGTELTEMYTAMQLDFWKNYQNK